MEIILVLLVMLLSYYIYRCGRLEKEVFFQQKATDLVLKSLNKFTRINFKIRKVFDNPEMYTEELKEREYTNK